MAWFWIGTNEIVAFELDGLVIVSAFAPPPELIVIAEAPVPVITEVVPRVS